MRFVLLLASALLIAVPASAQEIRETYLPPIDPEGVVEPGTYRDRSNFETFHAIRLHEDGTYEWAVSAGAMDRRSAGTWEMREGYAVLTTVPTPVAPLFRREADDTSADAPFLMVRWENGQPIQGIYFTLICDNGKIIRHYTQEDGWDLVPGECDNPVSISIEERMYDVGPEYFDLDELEGGLRITLIANDFGILDMTGTHIIPTETGITMWLEEITAQMERVDEGE